MTYAAPVKDILFTMHYVAGFDAAAADGLYDALDADTAASLLDEAAKLASGVLAPLNWPGDRAGAKWSAEGVTAAPGFADAYRQWREGGWASVTGPESHGGMGLPHLLNSACIEMWNSANMGFSLCPLLTAGAVEAIAAHGSPALKDIYLAKMVSGEWTGTMNLTEPQAGSDLSALRAKAERAGDGSYRIKGQKIFITYAITI